MDEFSKGLCDVLKVIAWGAGVLVRQFDLGRDGYLPEFVSKEGREVIHEIKSASKKNNSESERKRFPMGFA